MPDLQIPQGAGGEEMASAMMDAMESFQGMGDAFGIDMTALKVTTHCSCNSTPCDYQPCLTFADLLHIH